MLWGTQRQVKHISYLAPRSLVYTKKKKLNHPHSKNPIMLEMLDHILHISSNPSFGCGNKNFKKYEEGKD
jgi:hypothetical protein